MAEARRAPSYGVDVADYAPAAPAREPATVRSLRCEACELAKGGKVNCLSGRGSTRSGVMIVAAGVGLADEEDRRYLSGDYGRKLGWLLQKAGLSRESVFVTGAIRCPRKKGGPVPKKAIMEACRPHLHREIEEVDPAVIVTFGPAALRQVLGGETGALDGLRGFPIRLPSPKGDRWVLPMWDITRSFAKPEDDGIVVRDLRLAAEIAERGWKSRPLGCTRVSVVKTLAELKALARRLREEPQWGFDLETDGLDFTKGRILCASFGFADGTAAVVPVTRPWDDASPAGTWTEAQLAKVYEFLRWAFKTPARKVAQNGKFDLKWLRRDAGATEFRNYDFDSMLAWALLEPDKPADLVFIGQWLGLVHEKYDEPLEAEFKRIGARNYRKVSPEILFRYAGIDAWLTLATRPILEDLLEEAGLARVMRSITMPLMHVVADMEYGGVRIDREGLDALRALTIAQIAELKKKAIEISGDPKFNPNSPKQLIKVLTDLGCRLTKRGESGQLSVDEQVLTQLARRGKGAGLPQAILDFRTKDKFLGTYVKGIGELLDADGFLHTTFHVDGTYTGRLSSSDPNLQNIPKQGGIREMFAVDEPGDVFLSVDYSQLEVRIAAALSGDPVLIAEIRDGIDMHSDNACRVWGYDLADFKKGAKDETHPKHEFYATKRDNVKRITFGVLYGSTAEGVSQREEIVLEEVEEFIGGFFRKYRVLAAYFKRCKARAWDSGVIRTRVGRRYRFLALPWLTSGYAPRKQRGRMRGEIERVSMNMPIQSFGSDIFSMRKSALARELKRRGFRSRLVLTIHDGFVMNVKPDERGAIEKLVPEVMNLTLNEGTDKAVKLLVDLKFLSDRWKK